MSITRLKPLKGAFGSSSMAWSIAPLIEVPPPNNCRGAASMASAKAIGRGLVLDQRPRHRLGLHVGPVHCIMVTAMAG